MARWGDTGGDDAAIADSLLHSKEWAWLVAQIVVEQQRVTDTLVGGVDSFERYSALVAEYAAFERVKQIPVLALDSENGGAL